MFTIEAVPFAIAVIPVAVYLLLIGVLRLRTRPLVTSGWRDTLTLGLAVTGLVAFGPVQLFFPTDAAAIWHGWVWVALFLLYMLGLMIVLLNCKPRLIVYGMDSLQFNETLLIAAQQVDEAAYWNDEVLNLPATRTQLGIEPTGTTRVHQVVHVGVLDNLRGWIELERALVKQSATVRCPRSFAGIPLVVAGLFLIMISVAPLVADPAEAIAQLEHFLNR